MTSLQQAESLADAITFSTQQFEAYTRDALQDYIDFLDKTIPAQGPIKHKDASEYSFKEVDGKLFVFESDEFHHYGEYVTDEIELPFAFVEDPELYKAHIIESIRDAKAKRDARIHSAAQARVDKLKKELEAAERSLEKAKA